MTERAIWVCGALDDQTRCKHYQSERDIIAIKFKCCREYYSCYQCHHELADHDAVRWAVDEQYEQAILCGQCQHELRISDYLHSDFQCPHCGASFNPKCEDHWTLYFEV